MKKSKIIMRIAAVALAVVLFASAFTLTASAFTETIKLETRAILLVDRSGSIEDRAAVDTLVSKLDAASFDAVGYFDTQLTADESFAGGGDSSICEAIDKAADAGFTHITVITDGEQWPADYSSLGLYRDLDLTIHLVEESEAAEDLVRELEGRLANSSLKVVTPEGEEQVVLDDYQPPVYTMEIPDENSEAVEEGDTSDVNGEGDKTFIQNIKEGYFPWWLVLILAALIAALFDFIHELITRGREDIAAGGTATAATAGTAIAATAGTPVPKPIPVGAVAQIARGAHVVADYSGSMAAQQSETAKACQAVQKGFDAVLCFGETVSEHAADELSGLQAAGQTHGWEAMEQAASKGWDEIVLVSDLGFNGKAFDQNAFASKFKKVTVVTPSSYDVATLESLKKIADEVEVLPL